jgi:hypothetical protein
VNHKLAALLDDLRLRAVDLEKARIRLTAANDRLARHLGWDAPAVL